MKTDIDEFLNSGKYLPKPLRDFHDQKDLFKTIHSTIDVGANDYTKNISWIKGQCYVIDIFLWFMARRGWTLQRSRANVDFRDLKKDIDEQQKKDEDKFRQLIEYRANQE